VCVVLLHPPFSWNITGIGASDGLCKLTFTLITHRGNKLMFFEGSQRFRSSFVMYHWYSMRARVGTMTLPSDGLSERNTDSGLPAGGAIDFHLN
jgi:hypothetical protein